MRSNSKKKVTAHTNAHFSVFGKNNYYVVIRYELLGADKSIKNWAITTSQKHQKKSSLQTFINVEHIERLMLTKNVNHSERRVNGYICRKALWEHNPEKIQLYTHVCPVWNSDALHSKLFVIKDVSTACVLAVFLQFGLLLVQKLQFVRK